VRVNKPGHDFRGIGATLADNGTFFKVWAPHAQSVALKGDFNGWNRFKHYLWNINGWWFGFQPGATAGQRYKFVINDSLDKPDPYVSADGALRRSFNHKRPLGLPLDGQRVENA